jgi:tRNA A-37 threonylcarbamoyl transferase component Bud32
MPHIIGIYDTYIIKRFGSGLDQIRFKTETQCYQQLDGLHITPKLLEVGDNYLKIEKFDLSLEDALIHRLLNYTQYRVIYDKVVELVKKLDQIGIMHGDLSPRNIVCRKNFTELAIIDFELAVHVNTYKGCVGASNIDAQFYEKFSFDF